MEKCANSASCLRLTTANLWLAVDIVTKLFVVMANQV